MLEAHVFGGAGAVGVAGAYLVAHWITSNVAILPHYIGRPVAYNDLAGGTHMVDPVFRQGIPNFVAVPYQALVVHLRDTSLAKYEAKMWCKSARCPHDAQAYQFAAADTDGTVLDSKPGSSNSSEDNSLRCAGHDCVLYPGVGRQPVHLASDEIERSWARHCQLALKLSAMDRLWNKVRT